jgi:FG-GAP repeat/Secretion system C-terminal sorting domain
MKQSLILSTLFLPLFFSVQPCLPQSTLHQIATMTGDSLGDEFDVVSYVGDVNGDGFNDILVGAPEGNYAKLFFGGKTLDTIPDMIFHCEQGASRFGWAIAGGQDINGDGYPDFVIGAPYYWYGGKPNGIPESGKIYVYFGGPNLDTIPNAVMSVDHWYYDFGYSVAIGDINGDGYADIIVDAPNDEIDAHGRIYVYFGGKVLHSEPDLIIEGTEGQDNLGWSLAYAGDLNKDGYGDFLAGAPQFQSISPTFRGGKAYLFYGGPNIGFSNSALLVGDSVRPGQFGKVVAGLGDVNGDGYNDIGIMAEKFIKILSGKTLEPIFRLNVDTLAWAFQTVVGLGDLNKDGLSDIGTGVQDRANRYSGMLRVYLGKETPDTLPDYEISGTSDNGYFACSIAGVGNIKGEGSREIAVGQNDAYGASGPGHTFILSLDVPNGVKENIVSKSPTEYRLYQNFPNPFNPSTIIRYALPANALVVLKVFDLLGRDVGTLVNERQNAGSHSLRFNAASLPSGVYFYQLTAGGFVHTKKLIVLR